MITAINFPTHMSDEEEDEKEKENKRQQRRQGGGDDYSNQFYHPHVWHNLGRNTFVVWSKKNVFF